MGQSALKSTGSFSIVIDGIEGICPAGERWAKKNMSEQKIPVFACEGPCIRGEIARLSANLIARANPRYARSCYAEAALVPYSTMARWAHGAEKAVVIDGCFLKCMGRMITNLVDMGRIVHIDAHPLYKKYSDVFSLDDVPEEERKEVANVVAEKILSKLNHGRE